MILGFVYIVAISMVIINKKQKCIFVTIYDVNKVVELIMFCLVAIFVDYIWCKQIT